MDRVFDEFWGTARLPTDSGRSGLNITATKIDISEDDKQVEITAELPGLEEKDVNVTLHDGVLTIEGERKNETEDKNEAKRYHLIERSYGAFRRVIPVGDGIDDDKVKAIFKNGVLTISLPKTEARQEKSKQIEIKTA
ncbi:MAG: Hsp20/alpha crystallin family protein [Alphaproteobacteria bacterium]|nr:Hsp20/alpha crystallin family protein [Alphaproteobacteria bacterium]